MHMIFSAISRASRRSVGSPSHGSAANWQPYAAALVLAALGASTGLHAQALKSETPAQATVPAASHPGLDLRASVSAPLNLSDPGADNIAVSSASSSSSEADTDPVASERLSLSDVNQPPPRRRYGRPRYSDRNHNADGSNKLAFVVGGGLTVPVGGTGRDLTTSYRLMGGVGYNFSKQFGVIAQFDYDHFGLPGSVIRAQQAAYAGLQIRDPQTGTTLDVSGLDANAHIWSFTLNPTFTVAQGERSSAYVVAGAGLYHKAVNFTLPSTGTYCDYYYGCYQVTSNQNFDTYTNNSFGISGGLGYTYKLSRFSNAKLFTEARYVWVANSKNYQSATQAAAAGNYYPQANDRAGYIPITFGIRW